ncbi:hypothetical protein Tco_0440307, partial [Tanacetum coccineum]
MMLLMCLEHQTCLLEVVEEEALDLLEVYPDGHDPLNSLVLCRGSCDLHGFCRTQFPTFVVEESLLCQLQ